MLSFSEENLSIVYSVQELLHFYWHVLLASASQFHCMPLSALTYLLTWLLKALCSRLYICLSICVW